MKYLKKSSNILIYGVGILVFIIVVYIVNKFLSKESFTKYGNIMNEGFQSNKISGDIIIIGVLTDLSSIYSDLAGPGAVIAAKMAIDDFSKDGTVIGKKIELVSADHQNNANIAANKAQEWYDKDGVDVIVELCSSNVALAVMEVAEQKKKITMVSGAGALAITNEKCTANNVHWTYDFYGISNGAGKAVVNQGKKNWYFITADYKFGADLEKYTTASINANNGKVLSTTKTVLNTSDFSSYLLKAKNSGADVVALATAGQDTINAIKQASAPANGINKTKQTIFPLLMFISDVHSLGLDIAQELYVVESFYWDRDNKTRAWSNKFMKIYKKMPTSIQAGIYSSVLAYLNAVQKAGTDDTQAVMKALKSTNINDGLFTGKIRADGKFVHDMYLYQVKKPSESRHLWDYYKPLAVISATDATLPLSQSNCKLVKKSINK